MICRFGKFIFKLLCSCFCMVFCCCCRKKSKSKKKEFRIETKPINRYNMRDYCSTAPQTLGTRMDTRGSRINEYIYVNNNYGQPEGSTLVHTNVTPTVGVHRDPPPQYHEIDFKN